MYRNAKRHRWIADDAVELDHNPAGERRLSPHYISAVVLRELSLRLVPWIGWAWLLVAFGLAVHRHRDELMA
ncbi:MAG: hypothetical protein E6Q98_16605 [Rhodospirillaceae bacterium]|nr:MAG: hypothetical protein E6Q98_16605 [Rhodospirillaceae bacterium]